MKLTKRKKLNNSLRILTTLKTISARSLVLLIKSLRLSALSNNLNRRCPQLNTQPTSSTTQSKLDRTIRLLRLCTAKNLKLRFMLSLCAAALALTLLINSIRNLLELMLNCTNYALNSVRI
jgi:hypothetical protein